MGTPQKNRLENEVEQPDESSIPVQGRGQSNYEKPNTSSDNPQGQGAISRLDTASYVHDMAMELRALAETAKLSFLAYLLQLVIEESAAQKRGRL